MRSLTILILSLTLFSALPPSSECYQNKQESYCFRDNQFSWQRLINNKKEIGNGTFAIKGDSIQLNFGTAVREFDISVSSSPANSENVTIRINAMRSNGTPIQGLKITLQKSDLRAQTNTKGEAQIDIPKPMLNDELSVEYNGQRSPGLKLDMKGFNNLLGIVIDEDVQYRENQSVTLPYRKSGRKIKINGRSFNKLKP